MIQCEHEVLHRNPYIVVVDFQEDLHHRYCMARSPYATEVSVLSKHEKRHLVFELNSPS